MFSTPLPFSFFLLAFYAYYVTNYPGEVGNLFSLHNLRNPRQTPGRSSHKGTDFLSFCS
jgi:hypothetical protein